MNDSFISEPKQMVEALWSPTDNASREPHLQSQVSRLIESHSQRRLSFTADLNQSSAASASGNRGSHLKVGSGYRTGTSGGNSSGLPVRGSPRVDVEEKYEEAMRTISELEHDLEAKGAVIKGFESREKKWEKKERQDIGEREVMKE